MIFKKYKMEIIEIISTYINKDNNILKVEFRGINDEGIRQDIIEFEYLKEFGYYGDDMVGIYDSIDIDDDWDDWESDDNDTYLDDDTIMTFLNEYYIVFPDRIPDEEYN